MERKGTLSRTLNVKQLRRVYEHLENETRPYDATAQTIKKGKLLTIRLRLEDKPYFQNLVKTACDEVKE